MEAFLEGVTSKLSLENMENLISGMCSQNLKGCIMKVLLSTRGKGEKTGREINRCPNMEGFPCYIIVCRLDRKSIRNS